MPDSSKVIICQSDQVMENRPLPDPYTQALWMAFRQALLMMVDAIEVYMGVETRTSELRKRFKNE